MTLARRCKMVLIDSVQWAHSRAMRPSLSSWIGLARGSRAVAGVHMARRIALIAAGLVSSLFVASGSAFGQTFSYTGAEQSYPVPAGVTEVHVVVVGAPGYGGPVFGGDGAVVSADVPIPAGQMVLYVEVGGTAPLTSASSRGFNGGGAPSGGGGSDVRLIPLAQAGSIDSRIVVAGGGGGVNAVAGGNAGANGANYSEADGGAAGTASGGGAGGLASPACPGDNGSPGSLGQGGDGNNGGGGGGGYYGGGGGGAAVCGTYDARGGGGGGGSSYVNPDAANATFGLDTSQTAGVTITPIATTPTPPPPAPPIAPTPAVALTALHISPSALAVSGRRVAGRCEPLTHRNRNRAQCRRPIALHISYHLNAPAVVTLTVEQTLAGRLVGGRCVAIKRANRHKRSCGRLQALPGKLSESGTAGANRLPFTGKIGGRTLKPGSYRLTATPTANGTTGAPQSATFRLK